LSLRPITTRVAALTKLKVMGRLTDEQRRALRLLARHPHGCAEAKLLEQGFTVAQLGHLVFLGFAKIRAGGRHKVFVVKITEAGRKAIAE
jgi:hypothetical protein